MSTLGPLSTALEAQLRKQVQQNGIVVLLDRDCHYTDLVDRLRSLRAEEQLPYAVHGFRGSQLALMFDLAAVEKEAIRRPGRQPPAGQRAAPPRSRPLVGAPREGGGYGAAAFRQAGRPVQPAGS